MNPLSYIELKQISNKNSPSDLAKDLGFEKTLKIARCMLINDAWDEALQTYATHLLEEIKKQYPKKWNSSWEYEAFLGYAYDIILEYDKRYASFKNAFDKISRPPPQLLVALAGCCWSPGKPPISEEEAILLVKQAISTVPYIEAVDLLKGLYKSTGNIQEQLYWGNFLENIRENGVHLPSLDQISNS